jgi:ComF family protein
VSDGRARSLDWDDTIRGPLRAIARGALDRLFPWSCVACGVAAGGALCDPCLSSLRWIEEPCCPRCGLPLASRPSHLCGRCLANPPSFERLRAVVGYRSDAQEADPAGKALRALKYGGRRAIAPTLSRLLAERFPFDPAGLDVVVPVPLHLGRLRERGFNQALLLAREPARRCGLPLDPWLLERRHPTPPQVGLDLAQRRRNLRDAFAVREGRSAAGLRVLLVDDVCTSMATVEACARSLLDAGARSVDALVLARTLWH